MRAKLNSRRGGSWPGVVAVGVKILHTTQRHVPGVLTFDCDNVSRIHRVTHISDGEDTRPGRSHGGIHDGSSSHGLDVEASHPSNLVIGDPIAGDDDGVTRDVRPLPRHRVLNFYRLDSPSAMNGNDSRVCFNAGTEEELARPGEQAVGLGLGIPRDECDGVTTRFLEGEDC